MFGPVLGDKDTRLLRSSGDDGDLEAGVSWPSPRFKDNGDGTIADDLTGLVWEQSPSTTRKSWADALAYANDLVLGDYSDWRLACRSARTST